MSQSQWQTNTMISFSRPKTPSYTLNEWILNNRIRYQSSVRLQQSADDLLAKSDQIRDIAVEVIKTNKEETDHCLEEKIKDIEYRRKELLHNRKQVAEELDALEIYRKRLTDTLSSVKKNALNICEKCLEMREQRLGIDLVQDEVQKELSKEIQMIKDIEIFLENTVEETQEQLRKLKAALYFIDSDLREKDENLQRNYTNLNLQERNLNLKSVTTFAFNQSNTTLKEWEYQTIANIKDSLREIKSSKSIRDNIDAIVKETTSDLMFQKKATDNAFGRRIEETKSQKEKLETHHAKIMKKANEMSQNVIRLEEAIKEKEGFLALAQTRMNNRCERSNLENTRDPVQLHLEKEIRDLNKIVTKLHQTLCQARVSLQLLFKTQIQLEEEINIKINTLKIDEVDCMTLRQGIEFRAY